MLGEVVGMSAAFPMNKKLTLAHTVSDPVEAHVDGCGATLLDGGAISDILEAVMVSVWSGVGSCG